MPRVALLVKMVPPYRLPLFEALQDRVGELRVFASTPMDPDRSWSVDWGTLDVIVQRNFTVRKRWRESDGSTDLGFVHFPYDTLARLWQFKPEAIISSELGLRTALAAVYKLLHARVRFVVWATVSEHTERNRGLLRELIRPYLFKCADAVLVNGASGARYVIRLGVPKHRVVIAPYTTDVTAFRPSARRPGTTGSVRLLFVGMLVERKGLIPFLTILQRWAEDHPNRRIDFDIVGDGPLRPALERFGSAPNLTIRIHEAVPHLRLPPLYGGADIFVLPTLSDEWGVVVNEAMAVGLPVLGSIHSQAVEELVSDNETGWTFNPADIDAVYDAIDRALGTPADDRRRMGAAGAERVVQLTPDRVADRIAETVCQSLQSS